MNLIEKKAYTINEFCQLFSIGRTKAYDEIKKGKLSVRKVGSRTLITADAARKWMDSLPIWIGD